MITTPNIKRVGTVCFECAKAIITLAGGLEIGYKLSHGGMNDISPLRQQWLNEMFPEDKTKVWSESKAAMAMHNRAMGNPHDTIYDSIGDKIKKSLPKKKIKNFNNNFVLQQALV